MTVGKICKADLPRKSKLAISKSLVKLGIGIIEKSVLNVDMFFHGLKLVKSAGWQFVIMVVCYILFQM